MSGQPASQQTSAWEVTEEGESPARLGWLQPAPHLVTRVDAIALAPLALLGLFQLYFCDRAPDFTVDAVFYVDAARTLVERGAYLYAGRPETGLPPGPSLLIALLCLVRACGHLAVLRAMVVLQTAGLALGYLLIRRYSSRLVAALIVLLVGSAPIYFWTLTHALVPNSPLLLYVMGALLLALGLEQARGPRWRAVGAVLLALLCAAAALTATAALALVGALALRVIIVWLRDRRAAGARLAVFLPAIVFTIAVQAYWMSRPPTRLEWPEVNGFPQSYVNQLKLKLGNRPELGLATPADIPARVARNLGGEGAQLAELLLHVPWVSEAWMSVLVAPLIVLVLLGWLSSVARAGGEVHDWYFAGNELIYLLWPWYPEYRFFLQVIPLAALYAWLGILLVGRSTRSRPRLVGLVALPICACLLVASWEWHHGVGVGAEFPHGGLQDLGSVIGWALSGLAAGFLIWRGEAWSGSLARRLPRRGRPVRIARVPGLRPGLALILLVASVAFALAHDVQVGEEEINPKSAVNASPADVLAAGWLASHTEPDAVVMARHVPTVYHYAHRRIVFFPPTRDVALLARGIRRLHVSYVLVVHREDTYYLPAEDDCFAPLRAAYPEDFQPLVENRAFSVYRIRGHTGA